MASTPPKINLTPQERFCESGDNISKHRDLVDSPIFQRGCDFAMLEMARRLSQQTNSTNEAIPAALMMRGAHDFLSIFRNLSEKSQDLPKVATTPALNYKA